MAVTENKKSNYLWWEIGGIALLGLGIFLLISLISYYPADPSLNSLKTSANGIKNWGGIVGSYSSDIFLTYFGITSYTIPVIVFILSLEMMINKDLELAPLRPLFFIIFIITLSGLSSIVIGEANIFGVKVSGGGFIGEGVHNLLQGYFNSAGTVLILVILLSISTILTTGTSLISTLSKLWSRWIHLLKYIKDRYIFYKEKRERGKKIVHAKEKKEKTPPKINELPPVIKENVKDEPVQESFKFLEPEGTFHLPPLSLLDAETNTANKVNRDSLIMNSQILEKKLADFDVNGKVTEVHPGPVITLYEFEPAPGIKINRIVNLSDDLALALKATSIRIIAPIPGKAVIGIEIPNKEREKVYLRNILAIKEFKESPSPLLLAIGKDISGKPFITDLRRMPHLLIAGSTGAGKSVSLNIMILSILYKATPETVRFVMIDPKRLELAMYNSIPHLLLPVIIDVKKAAPTLRGILLEMEERYNMMAGKGVKNIEQYNKRVRKENGETKPLPYIVIVIDEMADLMMTASSRDFEDIITRLAQMARAAGIHLIIATQRPSVDVITGLIKANFPARISFQVPSRTDSRTILDTNGAENLLGEGDMLFLPPGSSKIMRIHGAYISEIEIKRVVNFIKKQGKPSYSEELVDIEKRLESYDEETDEDEKYDMAVSVVMESGHASISYIQRRLRIGYNRAARMIERMEREGVVSPADGSKPREVFRKEE